MWVPLLKYPEAGPEDKSEGFPGIHPQGQGVLPLGRITPARQQVKYLVV